MSSTKIDGQKKSYKVVMEPVLQEKRKLKLSIYFDTEAPPGYTYIPTGCPDLTRYCKELSRKAGKRVYAVTKTNKRIQENPEKLAQHVNRVGHHFENSIAERAVRWRKESLQYRNPTESENERPRDGRSNRSRLLADKLDAHGNRLGLFSENQTEDDHKTLQIQQVRDTVRELFPFIPDDDLSKIVTRTFEQGRGKVGDATNLSLSRKVQLAVNAHIRHQHTNYDQLLKEVPWGTARQEVERPCLRMLVKWRGENEDDPEITELEEMFREVIVIDESDSDTYSPPFERSSEEYDPEDLPPLKETNEHGLSVKSSIQKPSSQSAKTGTLKDNKQPNVLTVPRPPDTQNLSDLIHVQPRRAMTNVPVFNYTENERHVALNPTDRDFFNLKGSTVLDPAGPPLEGEQELDCQGGIRTMLNGSTHDLNHYHQMNSQPQPHTLLQAGRKLHESQSSTLSGYDRRVLKRVGTDVQPYDRSPKKRPIELVGLPVQDSDPSRRLKAVRQPVFYDLTNED